MVLLKCLCNWIKLPQDNSKISLISDDFWIVIWISDPYLKPLIVTRGYSMENSVEKELKKVFLKHLLKVPIELAILSLKGFRMTQSSMCSASRSAI